MSEDDWSMAGDLGLGQGLKPGSLPKSVDVPVSHFRALSLRRRSIEARRRGSSSSVCSSTSGDRRRILCDRRKSLIAAAELVDKISVARSYSSEDPVTPLESKSKLTATWLQKLKCKLSKGKRTDEAPAVGPQVDVVSGLVYTDLEIAQQTIASLLGKLDVYQELLYGKYKASEVLLDKLSESVQEHHEWRQKYKVENQEHQKEINDLQFRLFCTEDNLTSVQRTWLDRFNSLVKENAELNTTVHEQTQILRKLSLDKNILKREKEELLAIQDAKERIAYQQSTFRATDDEISPVELGIMGACKCRTEDLKPCMCSKSACHKHKLLVETQNALETVEAELNEMTRHCQLYRDAFEEQLKRNKMLSKRLLIRDHSDTDVFSRTRRLSNLLRLRSRQGSKTEAVDSLVDMVCDRTDALLQQEILTKFLTQRVQELEK